MTAYVGVSRRTSLLFVYTCGLSLCALPHFVLGMHGSGGGANKLDIRKIDTHLSRGIRRDACIFWSCMFWSSRNGLLYPTCATTTASVSRPRKISALYLLLNLRLRLLLPLSSVLSLGLLSMCPLHHSEATVQTCPRMPQALSASQNLYLQDNNTQSDAPTNASFSMFSSP
ncbi:hypothetical protein GALMADRAFT_812714 [Galerina marginata CBS 339.88]|uniref:Uncharacterized protein n=1 Tax=Galerina marginata (strain CBS 339.88) TaxID=685588 RepID=A0A067SVV0_GALM3|nr:hypothetical protein GALMADRAFT_812714 [Galerina marginata CBS 339.88]